MLPKTSVVLISKTIEEIPWFMENPDYFYIEVIKCADYDISTGELFREWEEYHVHQLVD